MEQAFRKRPEGPPAIALFSVSAGIFAMGLASLINQALNPLQWVPVPGVTSVQELQGGHKMILMWSNFAQMAALFFVLFIVWMVVWMVLHESFARRRKVSRRWYLASATLLAAGLLLSFPPFYQWVFPQPVSGPMTLDQPFTASIRTPASAVAGARTASAPPIASGLRSALLAQAASAAVRGGDGTQGVAAELGGDKTEGVAARCPSPR